MTPRREGDSKTPAQPGATKAAAEPVKVEPVKPKEDLTGKVDLKKENGGYGLSLVGGVDTPLVTYFYVFTFFHNDPPPTNTKTNVDFFYLFASLYALFYLLKSQVFL